MTWTSLHEIAHHVDRFVGNRDLYGSAEDFRADVWGGSGVTVNPGTGSTDYARTAGVGEDLADTITTYLWSRQASSWEAPHMVFRFIQVAFLSAGRRYDQDLTEERINYVEKLFDTLNDEY